MEAVCLLIDTLAKFDYVPSFKQIITDHDKKNLFIRQLQEGKIAKKFKIFHKSYLFRNQSN